MLKTSLQVPGFRDLFTRVCVCRMCTFNDKLHMKKVKCQVNICPWSPGHVAWLSGSGKIAQGAINFAAWTAPVRLPVLMERTPIIIILSKKRACRLPHAAAETGLMESQP